MMKRLTPSSPPRRSVRTAAGSLPSGRLPAITGGEGYFILDAFPARVISSMRVTYFRPGRDAQVLSW